MASACIHVTKLRLLGFLLAWFWACALSAGEERIWKAAKGNFQVEATYLGQNATHVTLRKAGGSRLTYPKALLSQEDLDYLVTVDPPKPPPAVAGKSDPDGPAKAESKDKPSSDLKLPPATLAKKSGKKSTPPGKAGDTFESIRRSFDESFDSSASHEKQEVLPVAPGTDFVALVNELRKPVSLPTFAVQTKPDVRLVTAGDKTWQHTTCLAAGGNHLLEYDQSNKQLLVWNVETAKQVCDWKCGELANSRCFAISPSGKYLAVGRGDRSFEVYDTIAKKSVRRLKIDEKFKGVFRVAFNWQEESVFVLTESAYQMVISLIGEPDIGSSLLRYLPWHMHSEEKPFSFDAKQDQIELNISAEGRFGVHVSDKLNLSFEAADFPRPITFLTSGVYQPVLPIRHGIVAWNSQVATCKQIQIYSNKPDKPAKEMPVERSAPVTGVAPSVPGVAQTCSVDREERYLWGYYTQDESRLLQIVDVNYLKRSMGIFLPPPKGGFTPQDCLWLSAEKQRIVSWSPASKQLIIYDLQNFVEPPSWRLYSLVLRAFLEKRYDFLDGFFAELGKLTQPLQGSEGLLPMEEALWNFEDQPTQVHPYNWSERIAAWEKDRPDSMGPKLILAARSINQGWQARGQDVAARVTPAGMETFRTAGAKAEKLLEPVIALAQPPAYAFLLQLRITKMVQHKPEEQVELAKRCCKLYPDCSKFHEEMVYNLLPRWFGNQGDSVAYAEKIVELLSDKNAGELAYAMMGSSLLKMHEPEIYAVATEFDTHRITRGLIKAAQQNPDDAVPYFRLLEWVYYSRFFNTESEVLDPEIDEQTQKEYQELLVQFERLVKRHDWTTHSPTKFAASEYGIYRTKAGNPPKSKVKR